MTTSLLSTTAFLSAFVFASTMAEAATVLSITEDGGNETTAALNALTEAYTAKNPDVTFEIENRPGGSDGDNLVKTRLSTGESGDIIQYNSGSLFQALKPAENLVDLTGLPAQANVLDSFKSVVTAPDGTVRGVPFGPAMGGGIYYNRKIYAELGLAVPKTCEPRRLYRRPFGLSYAAMAGSSSMA